MKTLLFLLAYLLSGPHNTQNVEVYKKRLVYSCDFERQADLNDWQMEGPGIASITNGKLLLFSKYFDIANKHLQKNGEIFSGEKSEFYSVVEEAMRNELGDSVEAYFVNGAFRGGHLVYWNKFKTPDNYIIECDFQSLSENALHMLMFSCTGKNGEDVFSPNLQKRFGLASQYTRSDLKNYRISFFAPGRGTTNMRKSPGRILTVKGKDFTLENKMGKHHLKIIKFDGLIEWYIDGKLSFSFKDELGEGFLRGGQTAIRLMVPAKGLYDNYRIYEILEK